MTSVNLKEAIVKCAIENWADAVGFAPASRFEADDPIFKIMPEVKTVICLSFRTLRGSFRGVEEGTTYYQYSTMSVENMEETVMPMTRVRVANLIESYGYTALPQRRQQRIMAEKNDTNPEMIYNTIYRDRPEEPQMNFERSAELCGIGEVGLHGGIITEEFGPMVRYSFILTDAVIEPDEVKKLNLCDKCGECRKACPGKAIGEDGSINNWQCAVYYNGASGITNPFMSPGAYPDLEGRLEVIAGEAKVTPERAREILGKTFFYPPIGHFYTSSLCGKACFRACYAHLEEKGVLKREFTTKFRKREPWKFDIKDYDVFDK